MKTVIFFFVKNGMSRHLFVKLLSYILKIVLLFLYRFEALYLMIDDQVNALKTALNESNGTWQHVLVVFQVSSVNILKKIRPKKFQLASKNKCPGNGNHKHISNFYPNLVKEH